MAALTRAFKDFGRQAEESTQTFRTSWFFIWTHPVALKPAHLRGRHRGWR